MLTRKPDWQSCLSSYVLECAAKPFRYGELDCGLFVAGAIEAMTGVDVAGDLRGVYATRKEAFGTIRRLAGRASMEAIAECIAARCGAQEVPVAFAQRGDAVQLGRGRAATLGIVAMHGTEILAPAKDGLVRMEMSKAVRAWHI
jgi:hypothetical protein